MKLTTGDQVLVTEPGFRTDRVWTVEGFRPGKVLIANGEVRHAVDRSFVELADAQAV